MAELKGTATGTLSGQNVSKPSDLESSLQSGAALASRLLQLYTSPPVPQQTDFGPFQRGMEQMIESQPAPTPRPVPETPGGLGLAAGLITTALADRRRGGQSNAQLVSTVEDRRRQAQDVEAANLSAADAHRLSKHAQLLEVRRIVLEKTVEESMANGKAAAADKASKELFVVQTALDQLNQKLEHGRRIQLQNVQNAGAEQVARVSGLLDFLSRMPSGDGSGGSAEFVAAEAKELKDLLDFQSTIDLRIAESGRDWTIGSPQFGRKKIVSDEEMSAQLRTAGAYLTSPFPRVRATAEQTLNTILRDRFGDDEEAKTRFLNERGVTVAEPAAPAQIAPNTTVPR